MSDIVRRACGHFTRADEECNCQTSLEGKIRRCSTCGSYILHRCTCEDDYKSNDAFGKNIKEE